VKRLVTTLLLCSLLAGCKQEVVYAGKTEAQYIQEAASTDAEVRAQAAMALGHFKTDQSGKTLKLLLDDADLTVKINAVEALYAHSKDKHLISALITTLRSVIQDRMGWSVTDRLQEVLRAMGEDAIPLRPDIQSVLDNAPASRQKRWQGCLDAIRD
jgi:HEAT repeat protein